MCHLGNLPVFVQEGGGPAMRTRSHCIVVGNMLFFFLMANYIEIRHPPPQPRKGMCEYVRVFPPGLPSLLGKKA